MKVAWIDLSVLGIDCVYCSALLTPHCCVYVIIIVQSYFACKHGMMSGWREYTALQATSPHQGLGIDPQWMASSDQCCYQWKKKAVWSLSRRRGRRDRWICLVSRQCPFDIDNQWLQQQHATERRTDHCQPSHSLRRVSSIDFTIL